MLITISYYELGNSKPEVVIEGQADKFGYIHECCRSC